VVPNHAHRRRAAARGERRRTGVARQRDGRRRALHAREESARSGRPRGQKPGEGRRVCDQEIWLRYVDSGRRIPVSAAQGPAKSAARGQDQSLRKRPHAAARGVARADQAFEPRELCVPYEIERRTGQRTGGAHPGAQSDGGYHRVRAPAPISAAIWRAGGLGRGAGAVDLAEGTAGVCFQRDRDAGEF